MRNILTTRNIGFEVIRFLNKIDNSNRIYRNNSITILFILLVLF